MPIVAYENTGGQGRFPFFLYWKHTERNAYLIEQQTLNFAQTVFVKLYLFEYVVRGGDYEAYESPEACEPVYFGICVLHLRL